MNSRNIANGIRVVVWAIVAIVASLLMLSFYNGENPLQIIDNHDGPLSVLQEKTITEMITSVNLDWNAGGVTVRASSDDKVHLVERSYEKVTESKWASVTVAGGTLRIASRNKNIFNFFFWHSPQTYLELSLPAKTYEFFKLNVTSGNNEIFDLSAKKTDFNSTSGDLSIKNLTADTLDFNMTSGQSVFENVKVHDLSGVMTSGNLRYVGVVDQLLDVTITSGQFKTTLQEMAPKTIDFQMTSGLAKFELAAPADFQLQLSKTSGSFTANFAAVQDGNRYTYKTGRDNYRLGMTSGSLTFSVLNP